MRGIMVTWLVSRREGGKEGDVLQPSCQISSSIAAERGKAVEGRSRAERNEEWRQALWEGYVEGGVKGGGGKEIETGGW